MQSVAAMATLKTICVYCGSGTGQDPAYIEAARTLGKAMAAAGIRLVYGGGSVGLMGEIAKSVLEAGGEVTGIIPQFLEARERMLEDVTELIVTEDMHARKMLMFERAEAFVALPGGVGTLEEIFEVWTWGQLGHHGKPVGFLNIAGFFDALLAFLDHQRDERFMRAEHRDMLMVETDGGRLLDRFRVYEPPDVPKWISREER